MKAGAEIHSQTLGRTRGTPQKRGRKDYRSQKGQGHVRTQPTESINQGQGSQGLVETEATITDPVWV